jgi:hypothetical protein
MNSGPFQVTLQFFGFQYRGCFGQCDENDLGLRRILQPHEGRHESHGVADLAGEHRAHSFRRSPRQGRRQRDYGLFSEYRQSSIHKGMEEVTLTTVDSLASTTTSTLARCTAA